ncbi:MAG: acireductone synthase [Crocinitomicaceae bacterium]
MDSQVKYILSDIEGTTSSISFVVDELFPYFREHIQELPKMAMVSEVKESFAQVISLVKEEEGKNITTTEEVIAYLDQWSREDRKVTPLKTLQGFVWKKAYEEGAIKGHVFDDVPTCFNKWRANGLKIGIFSSGSIHAQKLLFQFSCFGDLSKHLSNYFDTKTGAKRDAATYKLIAEILDLQPNQILFLSDIKEELMAADEIGYQTIQLVRPGTTSAWHNTVRSFNEI